VTRTKVRTIFPVSARHVIYMTRLHRSITQLAGGASQNGFAQIVQCASECNGMGRSVATLQRSCIT
jgi:hypothetical protein